MKTIAVAYGDGIGPEIMKAVLRIMEAAGAQLQYEFVKVGKEVYESGVSSSIDNNAWELFRKCDVFLKGPITTPQGGGYKSMNVTIRKTMGLFANVRPTLAYTPYIQSYFPKMDVVIVRENEEDLYAGIEHQQTTEVVQCLKLISRPGSEAIIRYAFEYARAYGRKKITCMTKDNIMKMTDGMFHKIFDEMAKEYPDISTDHWIIDIGAAMLADQPERFDVVVTLNLYGDILSDITAQVAGSVGMGGSSNIGEDFAMFEAIHGSAPDIAGKNIANPSGLLNGACMMLVHIGQAEVAAKIQNALLCTLEDGIHTGDIYTEGQSHQKVGTNEFAAAIIERLGRVPQRLKTVTYGGTKPIKVKRPTIARAQKELVGVDVFIDWDGENGRRDPNVLGKMLENASGGSLKLHSVTNRGQKVYPNGQGETYCSDHWPARFLAAEGGGDITHVDILQLLQQVNASGLDVVKTENLYHFDGERGYTLSQGE